MQKSKQKEQFWGEIIRSIPENEKSIEIDTSVENVIGLWGPAPHYQMCHMTDQNAGVWISQENMCVMIKANRDVDDSENNPKMYGMGANPYHGHYRSYDIHDQAGVTANNYDANPNDNKEANYIANMITRFL